MAYPVHYAIRYEERASRLSTFFRLLLLIPHAIVLTLWGIAVFVVVVIAWFAILILGRYPLSLFRFTASFVAYRGRVASYAGLLTDRFPPFSGAPSDEYPINITVDYPEQLSRLTTFFRAILQIPAYIVNYALGIVAWLMAIAAWFVILVLGRLPEGMFEVMVLPQRYGVRYGAYAFELVTDRYPWFQSESDPDVPHPSWNEPLP